MKINLPNFKKVFIYADVESCVTMGDEDYDYTPTDKSNDDLREMGVVWPWIMGVSYRKFSKVKKGKLTQSYTEEIFYYDEHKFFFEYLSNLYKNHKMPIIIFHNASYDLTVLLETVWKAVDPDLEYEICVKEDNHHFINGKMSSPKYGFKCRFGDTMQYQNISLAKAAKTIGLEKGEIPYNMAEVFIDHEENLIYYIDMTDGQEKTYPLDKCLKYCMEDTLICRLYHDYLERSKTNTTLTILGEIPRIKFKDNTQGNHAISLLARWMDWEHRINFFDLFRPEINKEEYTLQKDGVCGGFSSFNKMVQTYICEPDELIGSYDVNSMYPFIMERGTPYGQLLENIPENGKFISWLLVEMPEPLKWIGDMEFLSTPPIPKDKLTKRTFYITEELYTFLKPLTNNTLIVKKIYYQNLSKLLGEYINPKYQQRLVIKAKMDQTEDEEERRRLKDEDDAIKVSINSIYGKMCQRSYEQTEKYINGQFTSEKNEDIIYKSSLPGIYICWTGRLMLYKQIKKIVDKGFTFLYADTDSIKFAYPKDKLKDVEEIFGTSGSRMGEWKNEGIFHIFSCPKRKKYMLINRDEPSKSKFAFSGLNDGNRWIKLFTQNLIKNWDKTLDELKIIFSPHHNVKFLMSKKWRIKTNKYNQKIIKSTDYETNNTKPIRAIIEPNEECERGYTYRNLNGKI